MRLYLDCVPCQVEVRKRDIDKVLSDDNLKMLLVCATCRLLHDLIRRGFKTAPEIATVLYRFIRAETGIDDPYRAEKKIANERGLDLYHKLKRVVEETNNVEHRLDLAVRVALLGNSIDLGVAGYTPPPVEQLVKELENMSVIGKLPVLKGKNILYLMDNAGEAALDKILAETLVDLGNKVTGVVKAGPFQNDVTTEDVHDLKLEESFTRIIDTGTDAASIFVNEIGEELRCALKSADLIIAKGMAHFEYITEIEHVIGKPIFYMFKIKCRPVSIETSLPVGSYVVLSRVKVE